MLAKGSAVVFFQGGFVAPRIKDRLDRLLEESGDLKGERQAGIVPPCFNRIHCLSRYVQARRQVGLGPVTFCSKNSQPVLHRGLGHLQWGRRGINWPSKPKFDEFG